MKLPSNADKTFGNLLILAKTLYELSRQNI
jgi:hypothetical protein